MSSWNVAEVTKRSALGQRCHDVTSLPSSPAEPEGRPIPRSRDRYLVGAWPCGHTHLTLTPTPGFSRQPLPSQQKGLQFHATPKHGLLLASHTWTPPEGHPHRPTQQSAAEAWAPHHRRVPFQGSREET